MTIDKDLIERIDQILNPSVWHGSMWEDKRIEISNFVQQVRDEAKLKQDYRKHDALDWKKSFEKERRMKEIYREIAIQLREPIFGVEKAEKEKTHYTLQQVMDDVDAEAQKRLTEGRSRGLGEKK